MLSPMVVFKGEHLNYEWTRGEVPGTEYGMSSQWWKDHELLHEKTGYHKYSTLHTMQCCYSWVDIPHVIAWRLLSL